MTIIPGHDDKIAQLNSDIRILDQEKYDLFLNGDRALMVGSIGVSLGSSGYILKALKLENTTEYKELDNFVSVYRNIFKYAQLCSLIDKSTTTTDIKELLSKYERTKDDDKFGKIWSESLDKKAKNIYQKDQDITRKIAQEEKTRNNWRNSNSFLQCLALFILMIASIKKQPQ